METQKTFKGMTSGAIVKTARVEEMEAGNSEVVVTIDGQDYLALLNDYDHLCVRDFSGLAVVLELSGRSVKKMSDLEGIAYK